MRASRLTALVLATLLAPAAAVAQSAAKVPAAISSIREADIKRDLYVMGGDDFRGREAGTLDEMRASVWVADEMEKIGLKPLGDMGSWFQWWNMRRNRLAGTGTVMLGNRALSLWTDVTPTNNAAGDIAATTVFV